MIRSASLELEIVQVLLAATENLVQILDSTFSCLWPPTLTLRLEYILKGCERVDIIFSFKQQELTLIKSRSYTYSYFLPITSGYLVRSAYSFTKVFPDDTTRLSLVSQHKTRGSSFRKSSLRSLGVYFVLGNRFRLFETFYGFHYFVFTNISFRWFRL